MNPISGLFQLRRRLRESKASGFDHKFYRAAYPDVAYAGVDPLQHYMKHGWREGRNPSASFHTLYYRHQHLNNDTTTNPLEHFLAHKQNNIFLSAFPEHPDRLIALQKHLVQQHVDKSFYHARYVDSLSCDPIEHYLTIGWRRGYDPNPSFSTRDYLEAHPHVTVANVSPLYHHLATQGVKLKATRATSLQIKSVIDSTLLRGFDASSPSRMEVIKAIAPEFDAELYLSDNLDVRIAKVPPLLHYVDYGWREGRNPNRLFWTNYYLAENSELQGTELNPFFHFLTKGRSEGRKPNPIGEAPWPYPLAMEQIDWHKAKSAQDVPGAEVDIILPVYKGYAESLSTIYTVLTSTQATPFNLIVINDCSPSEALTHELRRLHALGLFIYIENACNIGLVRSVNKGIALHTELDVILLNSDTIVHNNWIDRLLAHAHRDPSVATVTPHSNNATLCSYPDVNRNNPLALEISVEELDTYAAICNAGRATSIPVGVGFCFYIRRSVIDLIGAFDEKSFGRGYGEENDFCLRALKAGFKNLLAHDVFVYHAGQISFAEFAAHECMTNQTELHKKHPDYMMRMELYITADPGRDARLRLDLFRLARSLGSKTAVMLTHDMEGGITTNIDTLVRRLRQHGYNVIIAKLNGKEAKDTLGLEVKAEARIYTPSLSFLSISKHRELLADFFAWLQPNIFHIHSFVGPQWSSMTTLMELIGSSIPRYFYTLHDFSPLCHRNHLVTSQGEYCGLPPVQSCYTCISMDRDVEAVDPIARRQTYELFLQKAARIFVPSRDTAARYNTVFPDLHLTVRPHEDPETGGRRQRTMPTLGGPLRIALIGGIGLHKGSRILYALATDAKLRKLPIVFKIIGFSNIPSQLANVGVTQTGSYQTEGMALEMLDDWQPHLVFLPSIWPETYCYTLSMALAAGVPPVVFDIGAPAERLRTERCGEILDLKFVNEPSALNDALLQLPIKGLWQKMRPRSSVLYPNFLEDYYGLEPALASSERRLTFDPPKRSSLLLTAPVGPLRTLEC